MNPTKNIIIGLSFIVVAGLATYSYVTLIKTPPEIKKIPAVVNVPSVPEPEKTEFTAKLPTDFPANIPVEQGVYIKQSYSLTYANQKQLTIVFRTAKTMKENYALYADFLKKDGWVIANMSEGDNVSSFYGAKQKNDINITITKSQVSISVLKK